MKKQQHSAEDNWEGFQKVEDDKDSPGHPASQRQATRIKENQQNSSNKQTCKYSKSTMIKRQKIFLIDYKKQQDNNKLSTQNKNKKQQQKLPSILQENRNNQDQTICNFLCNIKVKVQKQDSPTKRNVISPSKVPFIEWRYPRIPIVRFSQNPVVTTSILYKGMAPRSSDSYMRTLKPINFQSRLSELKNHQWTNDIEFNSRFQSGNLNLVYEVKVRQNQFDLYMKVDSNTYGHRQWFYFSIRNKTKKTIKLNIYRFRKPYSLYQRGMRPFVRSVKSHQKDWHAAGYNVRYIRQKQTNEYGVKKGSNFYYLTFNYQFENDEDEVFFAAGIPYEYSFLNQRLLSFMEKSKRQQKIKFIQQTLGITPCGLNINMVKIEPIELNPIYSKNIIVINCRSHPGQVSASWVLDGLIDHLLSSDEGSLKWMTEYNICFHIIPMLNPDGVFVGNYRTGIVGDDFNRKFSSGRKDVFPQIYCLKKLVTQSKKQGQILMFMDLHGHSILKNSFFYGPSQKQFDNSIFRKLPFNLWHKSQYFKLSSCKFLTESSKIQTARIYFQLKENVLSYTCQNSLGLYGSSNSQTLQMGKEDWRKFGGSMVEAIKTCIQNDCGRLILTEDSIKKQEDLRETSTPPLKESSRRLGNKKLEMSTRLNIKTEKFYDNPSNNQSFDLVNKRLQTSTKTAQKIDKTQNNNIRSKKIQSFFFSNKNSPKKQSNLGAQQKQKLVAEIQVHKMSQTRQKLPILVTKQIKSKQVIESKVKSAQKNIRQEICQQSQQEKRIRTEQKRRKQVSMKKNDTTMMTNQHNLMLLEQKNSEKKQLIESFYHKHEHKQTRRKQHDIKNQTLKQHFSLGEKLTPVIENIRQKLLQVHSSNKTSNNKGKKQTITSLSTSKKGIFDLLTAFKQQQPQTNHQIKKYSCDFTDGDHDSKFENIEVALRNPFQERQRSLTYDESYLKGQIDRMKDLKQTERQYYDDEEMQKIGGWQEYNDENDKKLDDNFSQNFDDSVNDSDSGDEDLPQEQKRHIIEYIRTNNTNNQRGKYFQPNLNNNNESDQQQQKKQLPDQKQKSHLKRKNNINGFREIVFKNGDEKEEEQRQRQKYRQVQLNNTNGKVGLFNIPKLTKPNPRKFKDSSGILKFKSFSTKIQPQQKQLQDEIYITHKKKLNQRIIRRQSRKDPFVLVSKKEKYITGGKIFSYI